MADEDRPGEYQETDSADAHAEAAEALRRELGKEGVRDAMTAAKEGRDPRQEGEPEEHEEAGQEAAAEDKPAEATDEGEDYDPETVAEYPEDEQEEAKAAETEEVKEPAKAEPEPPPEPSRTAPPEWSDEDREAWEEFKQRRKTPPEEEQETPEARTKLFENTLQEILQRDPQMDRAWAALNARREEITKADEQEQAIVKDVREIDKQIQDARAVVAHYQAQAERDPDDELVRDRLQGLRSGLLELQTNRNNKAIEFQDLHIRNREWKTEYQQGLTQVRGLVEGEIESRAHRLQSERDGQKWGQEAVKEFDQHLPGLIKDAGIPEELKPRVSKLLRALTKTAEPAQLTRENLRDWMKSTIDEEIKPMVRGAQDVKVRDYAEKKVRDAEQPAPPADQAVAPARKPRAPLTSRDADRIADREIRQALKAANLR